MIESRSHRRIPGFLQAALLLAMLPVASTTLAQNDGDPDPRFGGDGYARFGFDGSDNPPEAVACAPDGTCYIASTTHSPDSDWKIRRVNTAGTDDHEMHVAFDLGGDNNDVVYGIVVQPDGKILAVGAAQDGTVSGDFNRLAVARLAPGVGLGFALDPTFGAGGKMTINFVGDARAHTVAVDAFGRAVIVGRYYTGSGSNFDMVVARLTAAGLPDATFDGNGVRTIAFDLGSSLRDELFDVALQADGKIVAAGYASFSDIDSDFAVVRLNSDGSSDNTFSGDGQTTIAFDLGDDNDYAWGVLLDRSGRILVGGEANGDDLALARLTTAGTLDGGFGTGGKVTLANLGGGSDFHLTPPPVERILYFSFESSPEGVRALTAAGAIDTSFSGDGLAPFNVPEGTADDASAMTVVGGQPYVVGVSTVGGDSYHCFGRIWMDQVFADGFESANLLGWGHW